MLLLERYAVKSRRVKGAGGSKVRLAAAMSPAGMATPAGMSSNPAKVLWTQALRIHVRRLVWGKIRRASHGRIRLCQMSRVGLVECRGQGC